jgi:apolipoprotein N-acyltransferase
MSKKQKKIRSNSVAIETQSTATSKRSSVWLPSLVSCLLLIAAFPPFSLYPLAWVAPIGWLIVCSRPLPVGRKGYWHLWLGGCLFWLVSLHSIRLAFWVLYLGWFALSMYLAIYIPLMVAVTRVMLHRWHVPLVIAAPVTWTGLELIRSYFLTGFASHTLAHSQAWQPLVLQIADTIGHGGLSFLIVMFAAAILNIGQAIVNRFNTSSGTTSNVESGLDSANAAAASTSAKRPPVVLAGVIIFAIPIGLLSYGNWRIKQADELSSGRPVLLRCLLLQENTPTVFEINEDFEKAQERVETAWNRYASLCRTAARQHGKFDLVVWPESTFTATEPYRDFDTSNPFPEWLNKELKAIGRTRTEFEMDLQDGQRHFSIKNRVALLAAAGLEPFEQPKEAITTNLLVGCDHYRYATEKFMRHSGALWVDSSGTVKDAYDKIHLVMFGEYIPLRPLLGWLEQVFGFAGSDAGQEVKSFKIHGTTVAPNVCFETMVPRFICWQVKQLKSQGADPDLLINVTNDSWFKGTSMLDHHLACSILCSVENRRPMLVAANTGLTAEIDGCGRLVQCTQRLTAQAVLAEPKADGRWGLVQSAGYPLSWLCAAVTGLAMLLGFRNWYSSRAK